MRLTPLINGLYYIEVCFLYSHFVEHFYFKWVLDFIKGVFCLFFKDFTYIFLEMGKGGRKRERNINVRLPLVLPLLGIWPATQACALTGN